MLMLALTSNKVIEEQSTLFIYVTYQWEWQCTFNKCMINGTVIAKTNSPYSKMYRQTAKITLTFEQSDGGTIHTFHL